MNCTEFENAVGECVETRRPIDDVALKNHARNCETCGQIWRDHYILDRAISQWKTETLEADLSEIILEQIAASDKFGDDVRTNKTKLAPSLRTNSPVTEPNLRDRGTPAASWLLLAVAASALIMLHMTFNNSADQMASQSTQPRVANLDVDKTPNIQLLLSDAGTAWQSLADEAASSVIDVAILLPPAAPDDIPGKTNDHSSATWIEGWKQELKPIRDDVKNAVDFLKHVLPAESGSAT